MSLKVKMISIALLGVFLSFSGTIPSLWVLWKNATDKAQSSETLRIDNLFTISVNNLYPQMEGSMRDFTRNRDLKKGLSKGDKAKVEESVITLFRRLNASRLIDRLEIMNTNGDRIFSSAGDQGYARHTVPQQVIAEKKIIKGLEMSDNGELYAFLGFPIINRGQMIGVGLFAKNVSPTLALISNVDDSMVTIIDDGRKVLASSQLEEDADGNSIASSNNSHLQKVNLPDTGEHFNSYFDADDGLVTGYNVIPVIDVNNNPVAHLIHQFDITTEHNRQNSVYLIIALIIIGLVISLTIFLQWFINKSFSPFNHAIDVFRKIAQGDLTSEIHISNDDEIGKLLQAAKEMNERLRDTLRDVLESSNRISDASVEFSEITEKTSTGMHTQQTSVEQLVTAITQMSATIEEVSHNTVQASDRAQETADAAQEGKHDADLSISSITTLADAVQRAAGAISDVEKESGNISTILESIRGIAEQTNLLALNAAIEAARAGEQGRGFAVVADEVRTLAQRTHSSTQEVEEIITKLIAGTNEAVKAMDICRTETESNVTQVNTAGQALDSISQAVMVIADMSTQIASATQEQSTVAEDLNRNVVVISDICNETLTFSDQAKQTSRDLSELSANLQQKVNNFKLS